MALLLCAALLLAAGMMPAQAAPAVRVFANDSPLALIPGPVVIEGILYLPLRPLARHFATEVAADRQAVTVTRTDGTALTLRPGRMEVWSDGLVWALLSAPVRLIEGSTFVPSSAVDVLFQALTLWESNEQTLFITTRTSFRTEATTRPPAPATPVAPAAPRAPFVGEFVPQTQPPLVASGYVSLGVAVGGSAEASATAQAQFRTHEGDQRVDGTVTVAASGGSIQAAGSLTVRTPVTLITVGSLTLHDSPLTLYQQGVTGGMYENLAGRTTATYFGGTLTASGAESVYGVSLQLPQSGAWTFDTGLVYVPVSGGLILKARADHPLGDGLTAFSEVAAGSAGSASGSGWRAGVAASSSNLVTSLSYLSLDPGYPAVGNSAVFVGRSGPLFEIAYHPGPAWSMLASVAALSAAGQPDRTTSGLLVNYRPTTVLGLTAELRLTEDASSGVHTRATTVQLGATLTSGRWGFAGSLSALDSIDLLAGTASGTSTMSLHAGYTPPSGLPVWAELIRSTGATESWSSALGLTFRSSPSVDMTAALRYKVFTVPTASTESAVEIGFLQPLPTGAQLLVGAGVKYTTPGGATTPYLTFRYGYPVYMYGTPRVGHVAGIVFADVNGNGARDPDEPGVAGVTVRIDGRSAAQSAGDGRLAVEGVGEGQYVISIDDATVPAGLVPARTQVEIVVVTGGTSEVAFGLVPGATVRGVAFLDENGDGRLTAGEAEIEGVVLVLLPGGGLRTSDGSGSVEFGHLLPGAYTLAVDLTALPPELKVGGTGSLPVVLRPGEAAEVHIPLVSTKPVIKKTFP